MKSHENALEYRASICLTKRYVNTGQAESVTATNWANFMMIMTVRNGHLRRKKSQRRLFKYSGSNHERPDYFLTSPEVTFSESSPLPGLGMVIREYAKNTPTCSPHKMRWDLRKNVTRPLLSTWLSDSVVTFNKGVNARLWKSPQPPRSRQITGFRSQRHRDLKERWLVGSVEQPIKSFLGLANFLCLCTAKVIPQKHEWVPAWRGIH